MVYTAVWWRIRGGVLTCRTASFGYGKTVWLEISILLKLSTVTLAVDNVLTTMSSSVANDTDRSVDTNQ